MKNKRNILCGAFAVLALSLAGGSLAFTANAEETAAKTLADISIGMVKGASMRIGSAEEGNTEESTGLRFTMQVSKADYEALDKTQYENIEWGMLIAPVESVKAAEFYAENLFGANAKYVFNEETAAEGKYAAINVTETALTPASETNLKIDNADNYYVFSGYMHTIKAGNLTRGFVGRGYVKYTVKGEETPQYKFAEYFGGDAENNTRSAYYVAAKYVADTEVTNAAAKTYVQEKYLENATALATANVEITADNYLEDITIGTYKTEVSNSETVSAKIGEKYDLTAAENAKENYVLRTDLSTTAEPVYRGQQLSIKRYYESESYIPFSKTAGAVSLVEEEGETKGAYKYSGSSGTESLFLVNYNDWNDPYNDKVTRNQSSKEKSIAGYVNMKIRWDKNVAGGGFNLVSNCGDWGADYAETQNWCVTTNWFTVLGTARGGLSFYKESGYPVTYIQPNIWYKVALPVYTNFTKGGKFGTVKLTLDAAQNLYFKDVQIADKDIYAAQVPSEADPYPGETAYKAENGSVTGREFIKDSTSSFDGSWKYTVNYDVWTAALTFADAGAQTPAVFAKFVTAEIYFENVTDFFIRDCLGTTGGNDKSNYKDEFKIGTEKTDGTVLFYDMEGNTVTTLQNNTWYKMAIPVKAVNPTGNKWGTLTLQLTNAQYQETGTNLWKFETTHYIYLRNQAYGSTNIYAK